VDDTQQRRKPGNRGGGLNAADPGPKVGEQQPSSPNALGLDAGGHEPAPESQDTATDEARDSIQDAFDSLEATTAADAVWDVADRKAEEAPAPGAEADAADGTSDNP
jgi:hypothetical protein